MTDFLSISKEEVEQAGRQGQRWSSCAAGVWAPGGDGVRAAPSNKMMVKLPGCKTLIPTPPWLWDSAGHLA